MSGPVRTIPLDHQKERLIQLAAREAAAHPDFNLPVHLDLTSALALVGSLQLALRHPGFDGPSAIVARRIVDGVIGSMELAGLVATAAIARLGDDEACDV